MLFRLNNLSRKKHGFSIKYRRFSIFSFSVLPCLLWNNCGLINKYRARCYKKKTKKYIHSAFNLLQSRPLLKPHILSCIISINGNIYGTPFFVIASSLPRHILLSFLAVLKSCSFEVEFDFVRENICKGCDLGDMIVVGPGERCQDQKGSMMKSR